METKMKIPESLSDVTADWLNLALKETSTIPEGTTIASINIEQLESVIDDQVLEGGPGASGSFLARLHLTYSGPDVNDWPSSLMCKLTCGTRFEFTLKSRMIFNLNYGDHADWTRREFDFFNKLAPLLQNSGFCFPKIYYSNIVDKDSRGRIFWRYVSNAPHNVRSVLVMEDLKGWDSYYLWTQPPKERIFLIMQNVAAMHATFWNKTKDLESQGIQLSTHESSWRPGRYSWLVSFLINRSISSPETFKSKVSQFLSGKNSDHMASRLQKDAVKPDWLTVSPLEDGTVAPFYDPLMREMFDVFALRLPDYYRDVITPFNNLPPQTVIHGDFTAANHLFSSSNGEEKVVALDFQFTGLGMAAMDVFYFMYTCAVPKNAKEIEDVLKTYHDAIVRNGVADYKWDTFRREFETFLIDRILVNVVFNVDPDDVLTMFKQIFGSAKSELSDRFVKSGVLARLFLMATSLYVADKEMFMKV